MPTDKTDAAPLVYVSDAPTNSSLIKFVTVDILAAFEPGGNHSAATERAMELVEQHRQGVTINSDELPRSFFADYPDKKQGRLPHLFYANGFWCVSAKCAEVLSRFDLGAGGTRPIEAFQHDRTTPIEGQYAVLNFGGRKECVLPELSPGAEQNPYSKAPNYFLELNVADGDISVSPEASNGLDLWVDPKLRNALFASAPLAEALRKARVASPWGLKACQVVDTGGGSGPMNDGANT